MLENFFKLKEHGTTVRTEIIAGVTTFFTMAYIIFINPALLSYGDSTLANGIFFATCLAAFVGTMLMALLAKLPFAQASGMGLNAFFAFTVMPAMSKIAGTELTVTQQYQSALTIVFISGLLFIAITVLGMREAIVKAIPKNIKIAITGGIGLFLAFLGLQNAGIIVKNDATQVGLINFGNWSTAETKTAAIGAIVAIVGVIIIAVLYTLKIKGSILIGIFATTVLAYATGVTKMPDLSLNFMDQARDFISVSFFKLDFTHLFSSGNILGSLTTILVLIISFSLVDMFDTIGTLLGTARRANLLDENDEMPRMRQALLSDAIATTTGALMGTSTVTTYVESSAGIGEGGRTGLTSFTTAILFLVAIFLAPIVGIVPGIATAPALIVVGAMMVSGLKDMDFDDFSEALPGFLTIAMMPLSYSIANGIAFGIISYVFIKLFSGKIKETHWITWLIAAFFIVRYALGVY